MFLHQDDPIPTSYPLALGHIGVNEGPPNKIAMADEKATPVNAQVSRLASRAEDLYSFGAISATTRARISLLLQGGQIIDAEAILGDAERKFMSKKKPFNVGAQLDQFLPSGFKIQEQAVKGVPNYFLYAGVAAVAVLALMRKK